MNYTMDNNLTKNVLIKSEENNAGKLYIVATPIGNLKDITLRAIETLEGVDWIACEDTRHSIHLLRHYAINKPLISVHDHNEQQRKVELLKKLQSGQNGALISDAGTPLISDPGYHVVSYLRQQGIEVVPLPGPSAIISALSAAGMPTNKFTFEGFLPAKTQKKINVLEGIVEEKRTMVFYESPHRLMETLKTMKDVFGDARYITVAKELTKQFERFVSGTVEEVVAIFTENDDWVRGEFVIVVQGAEELITVVEYEPLVHLLIEQNLPVKQISEIVAKYHGVKKKLVYQAVLDCKKVKVD